MGLISSMLGGAAQSGMAMANKIGTENRANEKQEGLLKDRNAREDLLIKNSNATTERRDRLKHQESLTLAYVNKKGSAKSPWSVQKLKDENGAERLVRINSSTGEQLETLGGKERKSLLETTVPHKKKTDAEKEAETAQKAAVKRKQQDAKSESRVDSLLPPSNEPGYDIQRANLVKLIKRQDSGEYLSPEENGILLQLEEERTTRATKTEDLQNKSAIQNSNSSALSDHTSVTNRFLNQNKERYSN